MTENDTSIGTGPAAPAGRHTDTAHRFVAAHYAPRADAYVDSAVHRASVDLATVLALVRARAPVRVLDLGCGGGHVALGAADHAGTVVALDLALPMLHAVRAGARARGLAHLATVAAAAERLPFADQAFDAVLSRFSAHHWPDLDRGLREARRVLRPGGFAVFADTVAPDIAAADTHLQAIEVLRDPSHVRNRTVGEWLTALLRAGLEPRTVTPSRLRLDYRPWIERTRTDPARAAAILALDEAAPADVHAALAIEPDGSFTIPVAVFEAAPVG